MQPLSTPAEPWTLLHQRNTKIFSENNSWKAERAEHFQQLSILGKIELTFARIKIYSYKRRMKGSKKPLSLQIDVSFKMSNIQ